MNAVDGNCPNLSIDKAVGTTVDWAQLMHRYKMVAEGIETDTYSACYTGVGTSCGTESGTVHDENAILRQLVASWPLLSDSVKMDLAALLDSFPVAAGE